MQAGPFFFMKEFRDQNQIRFRLAAESEGRYDWLFVPGGPGGDSGYFLSLLAHLHLPGRAWLVDLPGNGTNKVAKDYDYDQWLEIYPTLVDPFHHPVLVGHSAGSHLALLFPELEEKLAAFAILNASPCLWLEEAVRYGKPFDLPDLSREMAAFTANPTQETFDVALEANLPYYFSPSHLSAGREMLADLPFPWRPAVWWQRTAIASNFSAKWIPQLLPTSVVSGRYDCITPYTLFANDTRFHRENIEFTMIADAGHFPWVENPGEVRRAFDRLIARI